jgi:hypothetical protein
MLDKKIGENVATIFKKKKKNDQLKEKENGDVYLFCHIYYNDRKKNSPRVSACKRSITIRKGVFVTERCCLLVI